LLEGCPHTLFAVTVVVIPRVVEKIDAAVHTRADQFDGISFTDIGLSKMKAAHADARHFLACVSEYPIGYSSAARVTCRS
jgi:hypothetical protein